MIYTDETSNSSSHSIILWNNMDIKNGLDSGMMPPPSVLPTITRRASGNLLSASDQMAVKAELLDENSRTSMTTDSMDRFPNAIDTGIEQNQSLFSSHSNIELIEDDTNISMIVNNSNTMEGISSGFPTHNNHISGLKVMDLRVKQEQLITNNLNVNNNCPNLSIDQFVDNNSVSSILSSSPTQSDVEKFIPNLSEVNHAQLIATNNVVNNLFGNTTTNSTNILFPQNVNNLNQMHISVQNTEETFQQMLEQQHSNHSPIDSLMNSPNSTIRSPLSQDIILNNPALTLMSGTTHQHQPEHTVLSPEIILNPTVTPSLMCHQSPTVNDSNNLLSPHTSMMNTQIISNSLIEQQQNQSTIHTLISQQQHHHSTNTIPHITRKTPSVAVKNMILNAAAEILTSQQTCVETQSTIDALISLNEQQQQQQQLIPTLYHDVVHQQNHHQMALSQISQQQQNPNDIMENCHNLVTTSQMLSNNLNNVVENQQLQLNNLHNNFINTNLSKQRYY